MKPVYIIAEAGVNHNGKLETALEMVRAARQAGADAVKFQTFKAAKLVSQTAQTADYQKRNAGADSQYEMLRSLELSEEEFKKIKEYCAETGIEFLSTPFDIESGNFLLGLGMRKIKVPSGELTNKRFLQWAAGTKLPVILSTGMADLQETRAAVNLLNKENLILLHCTTEYPAPYAEVNLKAMDTLRHEFNVPVGFSDHTSGIDISLAAVAMGARVIEKHFTLDKNMPGPDHKASLCIEELNALVRGIRHIESAMGSGAKEPAPSEKKNILIARKSLHAAKDLKKGEVIKEEDLSVKRPASGISPMEIDAVIGKTLNKDIAKDTPLMPEDIV